MPEKERLASLLEDAVAEMELLLKMSADIRQPDDFVSNLSGLTAFRACGMSLQYITEIFVKIRNICGKEFFAPYSSIPWNAVFGMRNFLSHEYGNIDTEGFFDTIKNNIPDLLAVTRKIIEDVNNRD
ncbi:MAG: DUF86 domain-containing protein [Bacteroidales bacterium]|nr:DUF86 domain-containing protein [Bacteroidales bacterium]